MRLYLTFSFFFLSFLACITAFCGRYICQICGGKLLTSDYVVLNTPPQIKSQRSDGRLTHFDYDACQHHRLAEHLCFRSQIKTPSSADAVTRLK